MGRVRVVSNRLPQVIRDLPVQVDQAVDDTARSLETMIEANAWKDTGEVITTTRSETGGSMRSTVGVGFLRGSGFYALFLERGTSKMAARPVVVPAAHLHEPVLTVEVATGVRRACQ